jgi:hypothetical protein
MGHPRDGWSKVEVVSKIISALFLPIVLLLLGYWFSTQQKELDNLRNQAENSASRLTTMLRHLSSENPKERELATKVTEFLGKKNQLPSELVPVLLEIANNDPSKDVSIKARQSLETIANENKVLAPTIREGLFPLSKLVYIQIANEKQHEKAKKIQSDLRQNGFSAPGIENVSGKAIIPPNMEVRYFNDKEKSQVEKIVDILKANGITRVHPILISKGTGPIEIWFSSND